MCEGGAVTVTTVLFWLLKFGPPYREYCSVGEGRGGGVTKITEYRSEKVFKETRGGRWGGPFSEQVICLKFLGLGLGIVQLKPVREREG